MNDPPVRLDRGANVGAEGVAVAGPDEVPASSTRLWWRSGLALAVVAALVLAAILAVLVIGWDGGRDGDGGVAAVDGEEASAGGTGEAVVAVTYDVSTLTRPWGLQLRFLDADDTVVAEFAAGDVELGDGSGDVMFGSVGTEQGLIEHVPAGDLRLEATLEREAPVATCIVAFTAAPGGRLVLRLVADERPESWGRPDCGEIQSFEEWLEGRSTPTGVPYVGLTPAEAVSKAEAEDLSTRVVAVDGVDFPVTRDLGAGRLDLVLFDDAVVAAALGGEAPVADAMDLPPVHPTVVDPAGPTVGLGTLAVDLEPIEGAIYTGFDVTLQFYGPGGEPLAERRWSESVTAAHGDLGPQYTYVLTETVPAGTVRLVTFVHTSPRPSRCETTVDVGAGDRARVTLLFAADERSACASVAAATAEADQLLGLSRGLPAPGFVGLAEDQAPDEAAARGWTVRVVARDGQGVTRTDDHQPDRVDLVIEDGRVAAAARPYDPRSARCFGRSCDLVPR